MSPTRPNEQSVEISSQARGVCPPHTHTSILSKFTVSDIGTLARVHRVQPAEAAAPAAAGASDWPGLHVHGLCCDDDVVDAAAAMMMLLLR